MIAVDSKERMARISLVGPAELTPEVLPLPAHGEGAFDEGGMRVVWAEVPIASAASAAQAVHAAFMTRPSGTTAPPDLSPRRPPPPRAPRLGRGRVDRAAAPRPRRG